MDTLFRGLKGSLKTNLPLASLVTYRIGGEAKYFYQPKNSQDLADFVERMHKSSVPFFVLGSGSNLLVSDEGYDGVIVWMGPRYDDSDRQIQMTHEDSSHVWLKVPAFFSKAKLLDFAIKKLYSGLEFSAGIPGSMGGAVYMNAGTKWGSYGEVITKVDFVSSARGIYTLNSSELGFKYRGHGVGLFDSTTVVSDVHLKLRKLNVISPILSKVDEIFTYRGQKQPLELPNCGSVFKNPENSEKGAGRLIEACHLKGLSVGGAEVSLKHANFILNKGNAKASDVKELISRIQDKVFDKFNIRLEPEVIFLGA